MMPKVRRRATSRVSSSAGALRAAKGEASATSSTSVRGRSWAEAMVRLQKIRNEMALSEPASMRQRVRRRATASRLDEMLAVIPQFLDRFDDVGQRSMFLMLLE